MKAFKNGKGRLRKVVVAGLMAAVLAVSASPVAARAATADDGTQRPASGDFNWISGISNVYSVPAGGKSLKTLKEVQGDWKAYLGGIPTEATSYFGSFNVKIVDKGKNYADFIADWYTETAVDNKTGRPSFIDTSKQADTTYTGGMTEKLLFAEDTSLSHQFVSGTPIKDFIIVNFYQQGNRQYAIGAFEADGHNPMGNIFMTRTVSGASLVTSNPAAEVAADWSGFAGYWEYKFQDATGHTAKDSVYIEPISADKAYVVIDNANSGTKTGIVGRMELSGGKLNIYSADGTLRTTMSLVNNNTMSSTAHGGNYTRTDTSARAPEYWNHISNKFAEANEWNG